MCSLKRCDTHTPDPFLSMPWCLSEHEALDDRMYRKMFICGHNITLHHNTAGVQHHTHPTVTSLFTETLLMLPVGTVMKRSLVLPVLQGLTDTTMAMGPAKLQIRVSYMDSQQKSGFP